MSNHSFFTSRNWLQLPDFDFQILLFIPNFPKFECVFCSILNLICSIVSILLAIKFSRLCHCGSNETLCRHFHNQNFSPSDYPVGFGWGGSFVCYNHYIIILTSTSNCRGNVFDRLFTAISLSLMWVLYWCPRQIVSVFLSLLPRKENFIDNVIDLLILL